jgi:hypothetical protein
MFDPDKVGSMVWELGSNGSWSTRDHSGMQGDTIETVEIGDYEQLLALYRAEQKKRTTVTWVAPDWMEKV